VPEIRSLRWVIAAVIGCSGLAVTRPAMAAFPGANGQIAFAAWGSQRGSVQIFAMDPDGANRHPSSGTSTGCGRWTSGEAARPT